MSDTGLLGSVIQGGSFGLLVLVVIYVGRVLIPVILGEHRRLLEKHEQERREADAAHRAEREKADERADAAHARRDEIFGTFAESMTAELKGLNARVEKLEDRTGEHRPAK